MKNTSFAVAAIAAAGLSLAQPALGQSDDKLGTVNFETSCNPEAQKLFNQGMLYQHSFWYRASQRTFEDVLKADPECGIAYWGIALSLLWNPHVAPPSKNLAEGAAAITKGKSLSAKTARERDYPPIAEKGLNAARRYAKIAPAAAHAQHMPSHIFTRVGYWGESISSNAEAARVAKESKDFHDQLHAMDYQVYAYLQLGQDAKAKAIVDEGTAVTGFTETFLPG